MQEEKADSECEENKAQLSQGFALMHYTVHEKDSKHYFYYPTFGVIQRNWNLEKSSTN